MSQKETEENLLIDFTPEERENLKVFKYKDVIYHAQEEARIRLQRISREHRRFRNRKQTRKLSNYNYETFLQDPKPGVDVWYFFDNEFFPRLPNSNKELENIDSQNEIYGNLERVLILDTIGFIIVNIHPFPVVTEWSTKTFDNQTIKYTRVPEIPNLYLVRTEEKATNGIILKEELISTPNEAQLLLFFRPQKPQPASKISH